MNSYILPTYNRAKLSFHKGKGSYLITKKGKKYLDFTSGIAVTSLGHSNNDLIKVNDSIKLNNYNPAPISLTPEFLKEIQSI